MNKALGAVALRVEGLSKRYRLGERPSSYRTLRDSLAWNFASVLRTPRNREQIREAETIWALRDVSFTVSRGEVVGIIGRNGAGKSTLLKILSRITEPTMGWAQIHGRVGSLLEVGTGFHPELTGRENVLLNGAILGMRRKEVQAKFDEIVAFAEVDRFIDTPVKHYSSGMHLRLAFAVAAHLEPEILIVDEVLAVGDARFQRKCVGKMGDVTREGRTVLFVSHNMAAVSNLCARVALLREGRLERLGDKNAILREYLSGEAADGLEDEPLPDDDKAGFILSGKARHRRLFCGDPLTLEFEVEAPFSCRDATAGIVIADMTDRPVVGASSKLQGAHGEGAATRWSVTCDLSDLPLNSGVYRISIWFGHPDGDHARFSQAFVLEVEPADAFGTGRRIPESWGSMYWKPTWDIVPAIESQRVGVS